MGGFFVWRFRRIGITSSATVCPSGGARRRGRGSDHRLDITAAGQLLNGADIAPAVEQVGGERKMEGMTRGPQRQGGPSDCIVDCPLDKSFINVVSSRPASLLIFPPAILREDPLPGRVGQRWG
jgi:hypothetical protein